MYSPKIADELVIKLYPIAKEWKVPMTRLVDGIIRDALACIKQPSTAGASRLCVHEKPQKQAAA